MWPDLSRLILLGRLIQEHFGFSPGCGHLLYFFIPPLVPVSLPWQLQEAGFSLGRLQAPSVSHAAVTLRPGHLYDSAGGFPGLLDN